MITNGDRVNVSKQNVLFQRYTAETEENAGL